MAGTKAFLIVGAGFSGAVLARRLAEGLNMEVHVMDQRSHIAGNCHTERDPETGVMTHVFGPHIFNTNREDVWNYVRMFGDFVPFINRVKAVISSGVYSLPVNLHTINQFYGTRMSPTEAEAFVRSKADARIEEPANFEEQALKMMGEELYRAFFYGYTRKQWGCEPKALPASMLKRLPMRFDYNDNYYQAHFQALPRQGYTEIVRNILDHPRITISKNIRFKRGEQGGYSHVFYTGPIDEYFGYGQGRLGYRTVTFKAYRGTGNRLGNAVINYPDIDVPYTRIHEHKHFSPWDTVDGTIWFEEYSKETEEDDIPFYPKRLDADLALLKVYAALATNERNISFLGRLGTYRYLNMDQAIGEALDFAESAIASVRAGKAIQCWPAGSIA